MQLIKILLRKLIFREKGKLNFEEKHNPKMISDLLLQTILIY